MVDSVNNQLSARMRQPLSSTDTAGPNKASGGAARTAVGTPVGAVDQVVLSDQVSNLQVQEMVQKGPPFDLERVTRIREAVAEGRYPVDSSAITEALFEDYHALSR